MDGPVFYMMSDDMKRLILVSTVVLIAVNTVGAAVVDLMPLKETLKRNILIVIADNSLRCVLPVQ